ncbi:MAG: 2-C-methyl-D-erythritol 4-phosphate cytidylyltransferase [Planctomycetota bacterium]
MHITVLLPAAGAGRRYRAEDEFGPSKLDEDLGGRPVLQRAVELFAKDHRVGKIIVAGPFADDALAEFKLRHADRLGLLGVELVRGGETHRYETVAAALRHVPDETTHVAIHDAARPIAPPELIERVFTAAERHDAVIPAQPVADTLKRAGGDVEAKAADPLADILGASSGPAPRSVAETVDRTELFAVQTPQVFEIGLLRRAYAQPDLSSTDDAQLIERLGETVVMVAGDARNLKLTTPGDLPIIRSIGGFKTAEDRPTHKRF